MKKGLYIMALMVLLIIAGIAFIVVFYATGPGSTTPTTTKTVTGPLDLSFKPFTFNDLLHGHPKVDLATSGKRIHSAKFEQIEQQTSQVRGLPLKSQVPLVEASEAVIKYQLIVGFTEQTSAKQLAANQKVLRAMGLIKPTDDLESILTAVLTEQIAGSYDPETKEITIVAGKGLGNASDQVTMSHEVTHALQDQNFGLTKPPLQNDAYNGDEDTGVQSLIEGDATETMYQYAQTYLSVSQLMQVQQDSSNVSSPQLDKAPLYIQRGLLFPYSDGLTFIQGIKAQAGGEKAVNNALRSPPLSTEQIMHPDRYLSGAGAPKTVAMPDLTTSLGQGWKRIDQDALGEFDIGVWFEQYVNAATGKLVGDGWAGNSIEYYQGPASNYTMPIMTVWDSTADAKEFFDNYTKLLDGRFGSRAKKLGSTATSYIYQAGNVFYYASINGTSTLALQATSQQLLNTALKNYPQMAAAQ